MADILITAVSASYTGTENADDIQNGTGNLRDITVEGLSGDDILTIGSAAGTAAAAGGVGLGISIGSSTFSMGAGEDTLSYSGQAGSGLSRFNSMDVKLGQNDDFALINGLRSASATSIRGNEGSDEINFAGAAAGQVQSAFGVMIQGNAGSDSISANWTGESQNVVLKGGQDADTIVATFSAVTGFASAANTETGVKIVGNKGDDTLNATFLGTAEQVRVNGNSGADTLVVTAQSDITTFGVAGGKGDDVVSAVFGNVSARSVTVAGSLGADTVGASFVSGGFASGFLLNGASGSDALTLSVSNQAITFGSANSILGGTGADTISVNVGSNLTITGASGFVADLGTQAAGTAGGGVLNFNNSGTFAGTFIGRGTTAADAVNIAGSGTYAGLTISAEEGADTITFTGETGSVFSAVSVLGGSGADSFSITQNNTGGFTTTTGGLVSFDGGAGADTITISLDTAGSISAADFRGGEGNDSITMDLASGALMGGVNSGVSINAGTGDDTIGLAASGAGLTTRANGSIFGGLGSDLITGTFANTTTNATAGIFSGAFTADGGAGADTISFVASAASAGIAAFTGAVFNGGDGADTISLSISGTNFSAGTFGTINGGTGNDSILLNVARSAGSAQVTDIVGGLGADSILVSGTTGFGIQDLSGFSFSFDNDDSVYTGASNGSGFDTIAFDISAHLNAVNNGALSGGSLTFSGYSNVAFTKATTTTNTAGAFQAGFSGGQGNAVNFSLTGGAVSYAASGGAVIRSAGSLSLVATGDATTANIISAVDRLVTTTNQLATFNIQGGSAGAVQGYVFVQGGLNPNTVIRVGSTIAQTGGITDSSDLVFGATDQITLANGGANGSGGFTFGLNAL